VKAVIFDMDGVIVDSETYWNASELLFLKRIIPNWDESIHKRIVGMCVPDVYKLISNEKTITVDEKEFTRLYEEQAQKIYGKQAQLFLGVVELLKSLTVPIALASSARRSWIDAVLDRFDIRGYFSINLSVEDLGCAGKPSPEIYLEAAKQLGIAPKDCIVIEDSDNGIKAAKSAGMRCIGFKNGVTHGQTLEEADEIIDDIRQLSSLLTNL